MRRKSGHSHRKLRIVSLYSRWGDWNYDYFFQTVDNYPRPSLEVKEEKVMENDESKVFDEIPKRKENVEEK